LQIRVSSHANWCLTRICPPVSFGTRLAGRNANRRMCRIVLIDRAASAIPVFSRTIRARSSDEILPFRSVSNPTT
jgi:hypothetical protein